MKYLNLTDSFFFSGGEPHFEIQDHSLYKSDEVTITTRMNSWNQLGMLAEAVSALRISGIRDIHLYSPYVLGARQDRVCNVGEGFTIKVVANFINSLMFNSVTILDPHSDVTPALIDECIVVNNHSFVLKCLQEIFPKSNSVYPILISPDAGSNKKIKDLSVFLNKVSAIDVVKCDKSRDLKTGKLTGFEVYAKDLEGKDCVIVDDICDGGGTFIGLAKELKDKNAGNIYLIVTHGIFSKFFRPFKGLFKGIYTNDSISSDYNSDDLRYDSSSQLINLIPIKL